MTTDLISLDSNFNAIIEETKIYADSPEHSIYKNANRYKHNDIIYIPSQEIINKQLKNMAKLPTRYTNVNGTKRFKEIKDYILTFNLLQQYFSPHEKNKTLIALDNRYIEKSIGSRYRNGKNLFFDKYFILEIKGIKGLYTSGYSLSEEAKSLIGNHSRVIHKDNLDDLLQKIILGTYEESKECNINNIKKPKEIIKLTENASIEIPLRNIQDLSKIDTKYSIFVNRIKNNYIEGRLYYTKDYKPYGRNYSYIHTLPKEIRNVLFQDFTEIDINSAAQSILYNLYISHIGDELKTIKYYIDNKQEVREKLSKDLNISIKEVKEIIQIITFSNKIPKENQLPFFESFTKFQNAKDIVKNPFFIGLSEDYNKIDLVIDEIISDDEKEMIKKHKKGKITTVDKRVYLFQNIETKIMTKVQNVLSNESFHLHDAVYVKEITESEKKKINEIMKKLKMSIKFEIINNKYILDSKKCNNDFLEEIKMSNNWNNFYKNKADLEYFHKRNEKIRNVRIKNDDRINYKGKNDWELYLFLVRNLIDQNYKKHKDIIDSGDIREYLVNVKKMDLIKNIQ